MNKLNLRAKIFIYVLSVCSLVPSLGAQVTTGSVVAWGYNCCGQGNVPAGLSNVIVVAASPSGHNLALKNDGTVVAWGANQYGECNVPAGLTNAVAIAAGGTHSLAMTTDGSVVTWGSYYSGAGPIPSYIPSGLSNVVAIAAGFAADIALTSNGTVVVWGSSSYYTQPPVGLSNVVAVAAAAAQDLALLKDGTVVAWGAPFVPYYPPPDDLTNVVSISASYYNFSALKSDHTLVVWGNNDYNQNTVPAGLTNVIAAAAGTSMFVAQKEDRTLVAWGYNYFGQTDIPAFNKPVLSFSAGGGEGLALLYDSLPVIVEQPADKNVYTGTNVSLAVRVYGSLPLAYQWQHNGTNIPTGTNSVLTLNPVHASDSGIYHVTVTNTLGSVTSQDANVSAIDALPMISSQPTDVVGFLGQSASFNITADGSRPLIYQWRFRGTNIPGATNAVLTFNALTMSQGGNYSATISNSFGTTNSTDAVLTMSPVLAWGQNSTVSTQATNVSALAGGWNHCLALKANGTVVGWGDDSAGQLDIPQTVTNVVAIAAGYYHSLALRADGSVAAWGSNCCGQTDVPAFVTNIVAIAAADNYDLALRADGTVLGWGSAAPTGLTNVVAIAAAGGHGLALRADGTVLAWGGNNFGESTVPTTATNVVAIGAGDYHSLGLRADGTVIAWGANFNGQLNIPASATNVTAIVAGRYHNLVLRTNGQVIAWGKNCCGETPAPAIATNMVALAAGNGSSLSLTGQGSPQIVSQPRLFTATAGGNVVLTGSAVGALPLSYQWQFGGTNIAGATNALLKISNVQAALQGTYVLVVSNSFGAIARTAASLNILPAPPILTLQPKDASVLAGGTAIFNVAALGTEPISYQWRFNGTNIPGATSSTLILTNVLGSQAGFYSLITSNLPGSATSTNAFLAVTMFTPVTSGLPTAFRGTVTWGDYNNDGFQDLLLGNQLYRNIGGTTFTNSGISFGSGTIGAWGDYDNDGNLDILEASSQSATIYRNLGNGNFTNLNLSLASASGPCVAWGDYDNDGRQDVLVCGNLYRNNGNSTFTKITSGLPVVQSGSVAWGDFDHDGFLDILVAGSANGSAICRIYRNNGNGNFTDIGANFPGVTAASAQWVDFDNDGWLDVIVAGNNNGSGIAQLFRNLGNGTFTNINAGFTGVRSPSIAWADYDNDGAPDLFLSGVPNGGNYFSQVYHNNRNGTFTPFTLGLTNIALASGAAWGDFNNDGRLDIFVSGINSNSQIVSSLFQGIVQVTNTLPTPPVPAPLVVNTNSLVFRWNSATDFETPGAGLSYNLRVGSTPGAMNLISPLASSNGVRRLPQPGNAGAALSNVITNATLGSYYWSVQAIDGAFAGSPFSVEQPFLFAAETQPATGVSSSQAVLNGLVLGSVLPATAVFEWGIGTNRDNRSALQNLSGPTTNVAVSTSVSGLLPGMNYGYHLLVTNGGGSYSGGEQAFLTLNVPQIVPQAAGNITATSASLNALINASGASTTVNFEYGSTSTYGTATAPTNIGGTTLLPVHQTISGLIGGQVYHYRVHATNAVGPAYSADLTFATTPEPEALTAPASNIGPVTAILNGFVRPNGLPTTAFFQYGLTTNYDQTSSPISAGNGTNLVPVTSTISNLTRVTTYHFRVVASNSYAVTFGADASFLTTNDVIALPATGVTMTSATLNGLVNPNGLPTSVIIQYGATTNFGNTTPPISLNPGTNLLPVTSLITNLTSGSLYFYQIVATNDLGLRLSSVVSFQALPLFSAFSTNLNGFIDGEMAWGDYDSDGRLDMVVSDSVSTRLYHNETNGALTLVNTSIPGITSGTLAWGDYNNDGHLDLLVTGNSLLGPITRIYRNNGNGTFTDINAGLPNIAFRSAIWGDFNNDGRPDVLLLGETNSVAVSLIYRNNGDGTFTDTHANLPAFLDASASCADYDNDGRLDILICGRVGTEYSNVFSQLIHNDGNGAFHDTGLSFAGVRLGFSDWADYDGDGYPDLVLGGAGTGLTRILQLYRNNGNGTFSDQTAFFPVAFPDAVVWGDYDNDGRPDLLLKGQQYISSQVPSASYSGVIHNNGDGTFTQIQFPLPELWSTAGSWADYDGDGKLDAVISGNSRTGAQMLFYHNNSPAINIPPTVPTSLTSATAVGGVSLTWMKSSNILSSSNSFSYNLRIGTTPGGGDVLSSLSSSNGLRLAPAQGNAGCATNYWITNLGTGTYFWSVQAVGAGFVGSPFAPVKTFTVPGAPMAATLTASNITSTLAGLQGTVYPNGLDTTMQFEWGLSTNLGNSTSILTVPSNSGTNFESAQITNLLPGTGYFYRIAASNSAGTGDGAIVHFQTASAPAFEGVDVLSGGRIRLQFTETSGAQYHIQASSNLLNWIDLGAALDSGSNSFQYFDFMATNGRSRFYRISLP